MRDAEHEIAGILAMSRHDANSWLFSFSMFRRTHLFTNVAMNDGCLPTREETLGKMDMTIRRDGLPHDRPPCRTSVSISWAAVT